MAERASSFNPEEATDKWNKLLRSERPISNRRLFELSRDIFLLHGGNLETTLLLRRRNGFNEVEINFWPNKVDEGSNVIEGFQITFIGRENTTEEITDTFILERESRKGRNRFTVWREKPKDLSKFLNGKIDPEYDYIVNLTSNQRRIIAVNLWEAHLFTVEQAQAQIAS